MEAGYIKQKKKRRKRRALRGANSNRAEDPWRGLEDESALASGEELLNPGNHIGGDPSLSKDTSQLVCTDIVKTTFDIQEEG